MASLFISLSSLHIHALANGAASPIANFLVHFSLVSLIQVHEPIATIFIERDAHELGLLNKVPLFETPLE